MHTRMMKWVGILIIGGVAAASAHAATFFAEDMEAYSPDTALTSATPTTNGGAWFVDSPTGTTVQIVSDPTGAGKGNVLEFKQEGGSGGRIAADAQTLMTNGAGLVAEYDIYFVDDAINDPPTAIQALLADNVGNFRTNIYLLWANYSTGTQIRRFFNNTGTFESYPIELGKWYHVRLTAHTWNQGDNPSPTTFDLLVIDESTNTAVVNQTGLVYNLPDLTSSNGLQYMTFRSSGSNYQFYLDNLSMTELPEPAMLTLSAIGGLLMLSRRKRGE